MVHYLSAYMKVDLSASVITLLLPPRIRSQIEKRVADANLSSQPLPPFATDLSHIHGYFQIIVFTYNAWLGKVSIPSPEKEARTKHARCS